MAMGMTEEQRAALLEHVKRVCAITWSDAETDAMVERMVDNAVVDIRGKVGIPKGADFDFSAPGREGELVVMRCFYDWNKALDEFERNYRASIMEARAIWEVHAHARESQASACL